uniref:hypothetical protein n=1 Tax=Burkholderia diffusa TaxID=488732 RepID=UPI001CC5B1A9|nr:hypothetical protein [Burkholderia diffusa]
MAAYSADSFYKSTSHRLQYEKERVPGKWTPAVKLPLGIELGGAMEVGQIVISKKQRCPSERHLRQMRFAQFALR